MKQREYMSGNTMILLAAQKTLYVPRTYTCVLKRGIKLNVRS